MGWKKYLYVPLAGDLMHDAAGSVIVGRRTRLCCDRTVALVRTSRRPENASILFTAAQAGEEYDRVFMHKVMCDYTSAKLQEMDIKVQLLTFTARDWASIWEILAAAEFVQMQKKAGTRFDRVIFVCENWREKRTRLLALAIFETLELPCEIRIETFDSEDGFLKRWFFWKPYETLSLRKNEERLRELLPTLTPTRTARAEEHVKATAPP